jgi:hypothetical protein
MKPDCSAERFEIRPEREDDSAKAFTFQHDLACGCFAPHCFSLHTLDRCNAARDAPA